MVQADSFNRSRLRTAIAIVLSANTRLLDAPGNTLLPAAATGLPRDSVANITQVITLDLGYFTEKAGRIPPKLMAHVDAGLKLAMDL